MHPIPEPSLSLCVLASGSSGNSTVVHDGVAAVLIDAGLAARELVKRLAGAGLAPEQVRGICVTHEHGDHTRGLLTLATRHGIPVYVNRGTSEALLRDPAFAGAPFRIFETGQGFAVDGFSIEPFPVPHDAYEPVGFAIGVAGAGRVGVVSDMGMVTGVVRSRLAGCRAVVVEANHDEKLLQAAKRPEYLKQRIRGRQGHLSNQAAADLLAEVAGPELEAVFLAHLSEDCNRPELARNTVCAALEKAGRGHVAVHLTHAERISAVWYGGSPRPVAPAGQGRAASMV